MTREADQLNTQGMARRSSIFPVALREAGRLPMCSSAISLIGRRGVEIVHEAGRLVDQRAKRAVGVLAQPLHDPVVLLQVVGALRPRNQGGLERRRHQRFEVAMADLGVGVLARDDFALLGDADAPATAPAGCASIAS